MKIYYKRCLAETLALRRDVTARNTSLWFMMWKKPYVTSTKTTHDFIVDLFGNMIINRYMYLLQKSVNIEYGIGE